MDASVFMSSMVIPVQKDMVVPWVTTTRWMAMFRASSTRAMLSAVEMCPVASTMSWALMDSRIGYTSGTRLPLSSRREMPPLSPLCCRSARAEKVGIQTTLPPILAVASTAVGLRPPTSTSKATPPIKVIPGTAWDAV